MHCLKCGRELESQQMFCNDCLADMERYPVAPGTPVHIPLRKAPAPTRSSRRRKISPEEQIRILKKRIRSLTIALVIIISLMTAAVYFTADYLLNDETRRPGQNYTSVPAVPTSGAVRGQYFP